MLEMKGETYRDVYASYDDDDGDAQNFWFSVMTWKH